MFKMLKNVNKINNLFIKSLYLHRKLKTQTIMKIIAKCQSNYEVAKKVTLFVFGENYGFGEQSAIYNLLPTAYHSGASFHIKWYGYRFKVGYHVNGTVYLYLLNK